MSVAREREVFNFNQKAFHFWDKQTCKQQPRLPENPCEWAAEAHYSPVWMKEVFGPGLDPEEEGPALRQAINEGRWLKDRYLTYAPPAIEAALYMNCHSLGSPRGGESPWYPCKWGTHPVFFLNFLRFCLRNGLFDKSLEKALTFLNSKPPQLKVGEVFVPNNKFRKKPEDLPPKLPLALIHGRFLGIPHPDHEKAISALADLKKENPGLIVVVAIDKYASNIPFGNDVFRASLLALMREVDCVTLVDFPEVGIRTDDPLRIDDLFSYISPIMDFPWEEQNAFYREYYRRVFRGRKGKFLYVNPNAEENFRDEFNRRCQKLEITPVGRTEGTTWSGSVLYGEGRLPNTQMFSPIENEGLILKRKGGSRDEPEGDPEDWISVAWEWLALHIAETYSSDRSRIREHAASLLFGGWQEIAEEYQKALAKKLGISRGMRYCQHRRPLKGVG